MTSEMDGDGRRTPAMILLDLVRDFVLMSGKSVAGVGVGAGGVLNKDCTDLIRRIAILIHLAEEIRNFRGENFDNFENFNETNSALSSDYVSELVAAIQAAKRLLLYPALNFHRNQKSSVTDGAAKKLVLQFQYVTMKLENALANLPYDHFCIPDEVEEQVDLVRAQLRRATEKYKSLSATSEIQDKMFNVQGSVKWMTNFDIKNMESTDDEATERQHCFRNLSDRIVRNSEKPMNSDLSSDGCSSGVHSVWEGDLASKSQDEIKQFDEIVIPEIFLCPISNELMRDPVTVSTGQTYERTNIQRWIKSGNTTCLKTQQQLRDSTLTSNFLLRRLITKWCIEHNIQPEEGLPNPKLMKFDGSFHDVYRGTVTIETLIRKLSRGSIEEQRAAVTEIRRMSKSSTDYREQIAAAGAIPVLVNLLASDDVPIQENAMSSILNLSLYEKNKKLIMLSEAIPCIAQVLKVGSTEGRECAAATIYSLSLEEENKAIIGASGVIPDLMEILEIGSTRGKKEAARALLNLSTYNGNKDRAVRAGIIIPLLKMLSDSNDSLVDEALYIMSVLSSHPEAKAAMLKPNSMLALTNLLKTGSPRNKENAAAIFLALCKGDSEKLIWLSRLGAVVSLMDIANNGTERGRRKATSLLEQLRKSI